MAVAEAPLVSAQTVPAMGRATQDYVANLQGTTTDPSSMVVLAAKDVVQTKKAAVQWRRSFFVAMGASLVLLSVLFGLMLASQELSKETHIRQSHVLTAGNHVVEVAPATQDVPLDYLPFMDAGLLGSIVGKSIMYSLNETMVYEIVTKLSKSVDETVHQVQINTATASLTVNSDGAAIVVAGQETQLCGAITCTKVRVTMADDLEKIVSDALEEQQPRQLGRGVCGRWQRRCECARLGLSAYGKDDFFSWCVTTAQCVNVGKRR